MAITAGLVKELRERTGSGMMECKKALVETDGDIDAAADLLRKQGAAKADKKAGRVAAEGLIGIAQSDDAIALVEVNCETDFVAKDENFTSFVADVAQVALDSNPADMDALNAAAMANGATVEEGRKALIAKIGENMNVRRFERVEVSGKTAGVYVHGTRIAVVAVLEGGDEALARDVAMHVAASRPVCVSEDQVPADMVEKEREILRAQALESGKPAEIVEKMLTGRMRKFFNEITLYGQPFVKDPDQSVEKLVKAAGASVESFVRMEVGEGIEKKSENFADEVMAQVRG
ncbi:MAG: translation elongation factor Ts [Gammaproteobacteria bacterium]